jgi:hypothetical protein
MTVDCASCPLNRNGIHYNKNAKVTLDGTDMVIIDSGTRSRLAVNGEPCANL